MLKHLLCARLDPGDAAETRKAETANNSYASTMNSSENNFDSSNSQAFIVHTMAQQQPYPSFWYQNPAYNPLCVPRAAEKRLKCGD